MKISNVLRDDIGFIELVDSMGSDLTIVNAARVSFGKRKTKFTEKDRKLMRYLAENKHWSPFRHVQLQFHVKAPEIVGRQFYKHIVGGDYAFKDHAWNEISGRYVVYDTNEFYIPNEFRMQSTDNKQASDGIFPKLDQWNFNLEYEYAIDDAVYRYKRLLEGGVAKEQARGVLPVSFYTEWYWTASLQAVANFITLRDHDHAQWEIRRYAKAMRLLTEKVVPEAISILSEVM